MMIAEVCMPCLNGLHEECWDPQEANEFEMRCCCDLHGLITLQPVGRPVKDDDELLDLDSTARKRTEKLYPIHNGMVCEWAGLKYAGGGEDPIIGCTGNLLYAERNRYARHHGPDRDPLNNDPGHVHRICTACHARWHTLNTGPDETGLPHDPDTLADEAEVLENEEYWRTVQPVRVRDND